MRTTRDLFNGQYKRDSDEIEARLSEAVRAVKEGRGSALDGELFFGELMYTSGYFSVAPAGTSDSELQRREGARDVFARILYLLDISLDQVDEYHKASLVELTNTNDEGAR